MEQNADHGQSQSNASRKLKETRSKSSADKKKTSEAFDPESALNQVEVSLSRILKLETSLINDSKKYRISKNLNPVFIQEVSNSIQDLVRYFEEKNGIQNERIMIYLLSSQNRISHALYSLVQAIKLISDQPTEVAKNPQNVTVELAYIQGCIDSIHDCQSNIRKIIKLYPLQGNKSLEIHHANKSDASSLEFDLSDVQRTDQIKPNQNHRSAIIEVYETRDNFSLAVSDFNNSLGDERIQNIPVIPSDKEVLEHPLVNKVLMHIYHKDKYRIFINWFLKEWPKHRGCFGNIDGEENL